MPYITTIQAAVAAADAVVVAARADGGGGVRRCGSIMGKEVDKYQNAVMTSLNSALLLVGSASE